MARGNVKTSPIGSVDANNTGLKSKIKTQKAQKRTPRKRPISKSSTKGDLGSKRKHRKDKKLLGNINTYNTTDTGTQMMEFASPLANTIGKGTAKVTYKAGKAVVRKVKKIRSVRVATDELKEKGLKDNTTGKIKTSKAKTRYRKVGNVRVEKDITISKLDKQQVSYNRTIKTGRTVSSQIKTGKTINSNTAPVTRTIKAGNYSIRGYRLKKGLSYSRFKHSNAKKKEEQVTGSTTYEAVQEGRIKTAKATNVVRAGKNTVTAARQVSRSVRSIGAEKIDVPTGHSPKIKTGRYIDPHSKRTLDNSSSARQVSASINTGQIKADINLERLQGRGAFVPKHVDKPFKSLQSFKHTNANVQEKDTGNTGIEMMQGSRVVGSKIRNTYRGAKNTVRAAQNVKSASSKVINKGKTIYTRRSGKINTAPKNARYTAKDIKNKGNVARKSVSIAKDAAMKVGAAVRQVKLLANPLILKAILIVGLVFVLLAIITTAVSGMLSMGTVSYTYILAEPEIIVEAKEKVDELNEKATEKIEKLLDSTGYDDIKLSGPDKIEVGYQDILAIMGVEDAQEYRTSKIKGIHDDFYNITTAKEKYQEREYVGVCHHDDDKGNCTSSCHDEYEWVDKLRLIITVEQYNFIKVMDDRGFDEEEQNWGMSLAGCNLLDLYPELADLGITAPQGSLTDQEINDILSKLPTTGATRENIVAIAESLVGKISYGWGHKADPPTVPKSLDCSGFTDYVFKLAGTGTIGAGTYGQWDNSYPIDKGEIKIGDLGFLKPPSQANDNSPNHVGIFVGYDSNGNMMFVHCQGGTGTVKTTAQAAGFHYFRRPFVNFSE